MDYSDHEDEVLNEKPKINTEEVIQKKIMEYQISEPYARLCRIVYQAADKVLRHLFNQIHPPMNLSERLAKPAAHTTLRRLKVRGLITEEMWTILYPPDKSRVTSKSYSPLLLYILLKNICSISSPYPNGWEGPPEQDDQSMGAGLLRFHTLVSDVWKLPRKIDKEEMLAQCQKITALVKQMMAMPGGSSVVRSVEEVAYIELTPADQVHHFEVFKQWFDNLMDLKLCEHKISDLITQRQAEHDLAKLHEASTPPSRNSPSNKYQHESTTGASIIRHMSSMGKSMNKSLLGKSAPASSPMDQTRALEVEILQKHNKQLTENIYSDDVVPGLVQRGILTHEEKNKVSLLPNNSSRMKMVINLLGKKSSGAFDGFCDVIKFKYKGIHSILVEAKMKPFLQVKPDESTECAEALRAHYSNYLSQMKPIPWRPNVKKDFQDFYLPLYLTNIHGQRMQPLKPFASHSKSENPRKILVEGETGVGKTTYLQSLLYNWTTGEDQKLLEQFKMVFYVDLKLVGGSTGLLEAISDQCFPAHYRKTPNELFHLINSRQNKTLLLLDGLECFHGSPSSDIYEILNHRRFREIALMTTVTSHRYLDQSLLKMFDNHLVLLGFTEETRDEFILNYCHFIEQSQEELSSLTSEILLPSPNCIQAYSLNPLFCSFLCLIAEYEGQIDEIATESRLLHEFLIAIQKNFCKMHNLQVDSAGKFPQWCTTTMLTLDELAYKNSMSSTVMMETRMIHIKYKNEDLYNIGLIENHRVGQKPHVFEWSCFISQIVQDYLAAKILSKLDEEDFERYVGELANNINLHNLTKMLCSFTHVMEGKRGMKSVIEQITKRNKSVWKGRTFSKQAKDEDSVENGIDINQPNNYEAKMSEFALSLDCVSQCTDPSVINAVARSLSGNLFMKSNEIISSSQLCGLAKLIKENEPNLRGLEIRLDAIGYHYHFAMKSLASAIAQSAQITTLRTYWTSPQLLSSFLATVFGSSNISVETLKIHDQTRAENDYVTASVWKGLWSATKGMDQVTNLSFTQCQNPALVGGMLRNLPMNVDTLTLNNCILDQVSTQYLKTVFARNTTRLRIVNLRGVQMKKPDFAYVCQGLKTSLGLQELNLSKCHLDSRNIIALSEALKLNKSLKILNISEASIGHEAARALSIALGMNNSLRRIVIENIDITDAGLTEIMHSKQEGLIVLGHERKLQKLKNMEDA